MLAKQNNVKGATADAAVRVRGAVAAHAEQAVAQALAIVPTTVQTRVGRAEAPAIRDGSKSEKEPTDCCTGGPKRLIC